MSSFVEPDGVKLSFSSFLLFMLVLTLVSCSEQKSMSAIDYSERLARVLEESMPKVVSRETIEFPRYRDLQVSFEEHSNDLLQFLALQDCELQIVIAERNSSLGRLATASQRLISEIRLLETGEVCLGTLADEKLSDELSRILAVKRLELIGRIWEATLAGPEFRSFWRNKDISTDSSPDAVKALNLLRMDIGRWLSGDYKIESIIFEKRLQKIAAGNGGRLLSYWRELVETLPTATQILDSRIQRRPLCFPGMKTVDAESFYRVMKTAFISDLQRKTARLNRDTYDLLGEILVIEEMLSSEITPAYRSWQKDRRTLVADGRAAIKSHIEALAPFLEQCGFM